MYKVLYEDLPMIPNTTNYFHRKHFKVRIK